MVFLDSIPHFDNQIGALRSEVENEEFFNSSISICTRNVNRFNKSSIQHLSHLCVSQHRCWLWDVSQCNGDVSSSVKRSEKYPKSCETTALVGLKHFRCTYVCCFLWTCSLVTPWPCLIRLMSCCICLSKSKFNTKNWPTSLSRLLIALDHHRYHLLNATIWSWHALVCIAIVFNQYLLYTSNTKEDTQELL